jgi:enterochelin esterase-like enzyme
MGKWPTFRGFPFLIASLTLFSCRRQYPFEKVPLTPGEVERVKISETAHLNVERIRFWSDEMKEPRFFLTLVPKTPAKVQEVFILNHGWWDRPEDLLTYLKVDSVYDAMLGRGELRPAVLVIPDVRFSNFFSVTSRRIPFPSYLTLVAEEVAGMVSQQYQIPYQRTHWGIGGFSFGGYLSLDVGRHYPGRFASVSVISGLVDPDWSFWPSAPPVSDPVDDHGRGKHTVIVPGPIPRLFLACGTDDRRQFGTMQQLHQTLTQLEIPHMWSTGPGAHTWEYWASVLEPMLKFQLGVDQDASRPLP